MKTLKGFFVLLTILSGSLIANAQKIDPSEVKGIVESKNYVFKAERAYPQNGSSRYLTPGYDLTVSVDTVISYLPFFGRAYVAPANLTDGGIKFTSTDFNYDMKQTKKGWEILIKPKDNTDVQQLNLDIFDNGSAQLRVISTNRQNISFNGYIEKGKPKEKKAF